MQRTLFIKLSIIVSLCAIFAIGLTMFSDVITERQYYADSVVKEIADQHVNPQEIITPFIAIPTTITPECTRASADKASKCAPAYASVDTIFAAQTSTVQDLAVSTDTYQRGIYHATSYSGDITFEQSYGLDNNQAPLTTGESIDSSAPKSSIRGEGITAEQTVRHWNEAKLIIPISDLRGVATLPTITIDKQPIKATYPQTIMLNGLSYVEVRLPTSVIAQLQSNTPFKYNESHQLLNTSAANGTTNKTLSIVIDLPLSGISNLNTVPTGQNFELTMRSNWHAPNFIGKALPNAKNLTPDGFEAHWQNQYLTVANNQYLSQCLATPNNSCKIDSQASLQSSQQSTNYEAAAFIVKDATAAADNTNYANQGHLNSVRLNSFGVSFAEPNDVYLQTERTMKYALLLILVSFGTFFLFEIIKSNRIHPIQYLLVGCALLTFYVLLLPLAEQTVFWQAYTIAASACVGLIGWYTYYVLGGVKRAVIFIAILAGLYAAFYGILTTEDLNLLLGAVFCFILLACVMIMTRKIDWYKIA